jgi:hypothetical protein
MRNVAVTLFDIVTMAIPNLWQRRLRTALNLIGIVLAVSSC